ncbi:MAG: alpha/beta fold hydrolase [Roseobacter sp.]
MADFLLIHGSCHGAWCWEQVVPLLQGNGHHARAFDLPGHGADTTPISQITLDVYANAIAETCHEDTILVGHSMGGYAIAAAACLVPQKIRQLIYLCAYVPQEDVSLAQMRKMAPYQPLLPAVRLSLDRRSFTVDPTLAQQIFYNDCPQDVAQAAIERLCPQATAPTEEPFQGTTQMQKIPRHYIRCLNDKTIPPEFQITMTQDWPIKDVQDMPCGHSPFFADPTSLVTYLERAIRG